MRGSWELVFEVMRPAVPLGMVDPPPWDKLAYARRHHIEALFSRLENRGRIALRRDKTRQSWISFAHPAATLINLRVNQLSRRPQAGRV